MALTKSPHRYSYADIINDIEPGIDQVYRDKRIASSLEENMSTIKTFGEGNHVFSVTQRIDKGLTQHEDYKENIRRELTRQIADIVLTKTHFTQILVPPTQGYDEVEVRARCVLMSVEELASLIRRLRRS